jgi:hypothetical protein
MFVGHTLGLIFRSLRSHWRTGDGHWSIECSVRLINHNSGRCTSKKRKKSRSVFNVDVDAGVMSLFFTPPYPTIRD